MSIVCYIIALVDTIYISLLLHTVGMDYSLQQPGQQSYSISFLPGEMSDECRSVLILEDSVLEEDEVFTMSLQTTSLVADLNSSVATVTINDNERNFNSSVLH